MAYSFAQYQASGLTYSVPFPYISKKHVSVMVDGVTAVYDWLSQNTIQLKSVPAIGAVIEVRRLTPRQTRLVDFVDGSILGERDLDVSALQLLFIAQEVIDELGRSLNFDSQGRFDANGRAIVNVKDPVNDQDAVSKGWTTQHILKVAEGLAAQTNFVFVEKDPSYVPPAAPRATYIHSQDTVSDEWIIEHNLKTFPHVTAYGTNGDFLVVEYYFIDEDHVRVVLNPPRAGKAYLN